MRRLILFLIRKRLGLAKYEKFQFANQKSAVDVYWFGDDGIYKSDYFSYSPHKSSVSLNWLLDDECKIGRAEFVTKEEDVKNER